jgi:dTDP-4-amino-4,6-dideoxygalactose transaminase
VTTLAINGGKPEVQGIIYPFDAIGGNEAAAAGEAVYETLSGYLGGKLRGGNRVCALEDAWAERFGVKHAIACNSATSGLMAAAFAVGLGCGDKFIVSPYTMSATVAAPMFTGAEPKFLDVEQETFGLGFGPFRFPAVKAMFITNLFGHPSHLNYNKMQCDAETDMRDGNKFYMIEDNAQSPFAMEHGKYAGTIGHIGVFSLNVHKHIHCGEGGILVTNDDTLASRLRGFINHGELQAITDGQVGLNLRMTEVTAAIALAQLERADEIIGGRVEQAEAIIKAIGNIPGIKPPYVRSECKHVYYTIPFLIENKRAEFVKALAAEGVPLVEGYVAPLYRLPALSKYARKCPVAEDLHDRRLFYFSNCEWSPTKDQIRQIGNAFQKVAEGIGL